MMSFTKYLLVFHIVASSVTLYTNITSDGSESYYITSPNIPCPNNPCFTLSEFAAVSNILSVNESKTNLSLIFFPENHNLDGQVSLNHVRNFIMTTDP